MAMPYIAFLQVLLFLALSSGTITKGGVSDVSIQKYNEKGEIAQLVYSSKAVQRDAPLVAFIDELTEAALILSITKLKSPLIVSTRRRIEYLEEEGVGSAIVGYTPDCDYARNQLYSILQNHRLTFGECPSLDSISRQMSSWMTRGFYTQQDDPIARPLAACLVLVTFITEEQRIKLVHIENSGFITDRKYIVTGALSSVWNDRIVSTITSSVAQEEINGREKMMESYINIESTFRERSANQRALLSKVETVLNLMAEAIDPSDTIDVDACVECFIITKQHGALVKQSTKIRDILSFVDECLC